MENAVDREKVIKGLECCMVGDGHSPKCELCPYATVGDDTCLTMDGLFADALALLKAQEPVEPVMVNGEPECGACRYELRPDADSYCPCCGQAVKWDEAN